MTAHRASVINAEVLILCSAWAFIAIGGASYTALIPGGFGVALLCCHKGLKREDKLISHVAAALTLLALVALLMPLSSALGSGNGWRMLRVGLMVASSVFALIYFIKSFRDARRARG